LDEPGTVNRNFVTLKEFRQGLLNCGLLRPSPYITEISERDLQVIFTLSAMTQLDQLNYDRHMRLSQVEFIEALARLADKISPLGSEEDPVMYSAQDRMKLPLPTKLENMISMLMEKINDE
jgi:hypothetical protein